MKKLNLRFVHMTLGGSSYVGFFKSVDAKDAVMQAYKDGGRSLFYGGPLPVLTGIEGVTNNWKLETDRITISALLADDISDDAAAGILNTLMKQGVTSAVHELPSGEFAVAPVFCSTWYLGVFSTEDDARDFCERNGLPIVGEAVAA